MKAIGGLRVRKVEQLVAEGASYAPHENAREYAAHYIGTVICAARGHKVAVGGAFPCITCLSSAQHEVELLCERLVFPKEVESGTDTESQSDSGRESGRRGGRNGGTARAGGKRRTGQRES